MFRKMRRFKQQLSEEDCRQLLNCAPRGVLAVHGEDGYPYAFPMNFICDGDKIYFHSAKQGHKLDALAADKRVSFCVMDEGYRKQGDWALNIKSVIVFGKINRISDPEKSVRLVRALGLKYYPAQEDVEQEIRKHAGNMLMLELSIDHMSGKLVKES